MTAVFLLEISDKATEYQFLKAAEKLYDCSPFEDP